MKSFVLLTFLATHALTAQGDNTGSFNQGWQCQATGDNDELSITFNKTTDGIARIAFFDGDSWYHLACTDVRAPAEPLQYLCSLEADGLYVTAAISQHGRALFKTINVLEVDRYSNEAVTSELKCLPN